MEYVDPSEESLSASPNMVFFLRRLEFEAGNEFQTHLNFLDAYKVKKIDKTGALYHVKYVTGYAQESHDLTRAGAAFKSRGVQRAIQCAHKK